MGTDDGLFRYEAGSVHRCRTPSVRLEDRGSAGRTSNDHQRNEGYRVRRLRSRAPSGPAERLGVKEDEIFQVLRDRRGNIWYATATGVTREGDGRIETLGTRARFPGPVLYEDPQGTVWVGKQGGLFRATASGLELVAAGMQVRSIYGDREGNLWVGTNGDALFRIRRRPIRMFTTADGLPSDVIMTVLVARDGMLWTGANCGGVTRFDGRRFQTFDEDDGLLNGCVWALAEDVKGDLWIGTWGGGAFRYHDGVFTQFSTPQGMGSDAVTSIVAARDGTVWFATREGLSRWRDGQVRNLSQAEGLPAGRILKVHEDAAGVIWAGTMHGLYRVTGDRAEQFRDTPETPLIPVGQDRDGGFILQDPYQATTLRLHHGRVDTIGQMRSATALVGR